MSRVLSYERVRATTLKSTYVFPLIGAAVAWAASILFIVQGSIRENVALGLPRELVDDVAISSFIGQTFTPISAVFLTIPFAQAFGHEYRDGTIRLALSEFPRRTSLFTAKLVIPAVIAFIGTVITVGGIALIAALGPSFGYEDITGFGSLFGIAIREAVFVVLWGLLVSAITALTRNMAAGIAGVLIWGLIAENLLAVFIVDRLPAIVDFLPIGQGFGWVQTGQTNLIFPMVSAAVILTAVSYFKFVRTDA